MPYGGAHHARKESNRIEDEHIVFPAADRVPGARWFRIRRVFLEVHVNRPLETHLPVLEDDGVLVLRDPVHRTIESPVEDDARRLAAEAWIVLALESCCGLLPGGRQLGASIKPRPGSGTRTSAPPPARIGCPP